MTFDFEAIKAKYSSDKVSKIFVGNADEIRSLIAAYEQTQTALEEMSKELKKANVRIKYLEIKFGCDGKVHFQKPPYTELDDD
jgi:hypothetical protein